MFLSIFSNFVPEMSVYITKVIEMTVAIYIFRDRLFLPIVLTKTVKL